MHQRADQLAEQIHTLSAEQLLEVERFVVSLKAWDHDRQIVQAASTLSDPAFARIWQNEEDDVYDAL